MSLIRRMYVATLGVCLILLGGCDTLEETGVITLQPATAELSFRFSNTQQGISREVTAESSVNLESFLNDNQYTRSDVVAARVTGARIRITTPFQENLAVLSDLELALQSNQDGPDAIATLADPPADKNASMSVLSGRSITSYVQGGPFQGVLSLVGQKDVEDEYLLFVTLTIEVDVEGI
ncbi:MAG: hypothetical protein R2834_12200 [Rhodothermales bacterium]